jgi:hypothetical protein
LIELTEVEIWFLLPIFENVPGIFFDRNILTMVEKALKLPDGIALFFFKVGWRNEFLDHLPPGNFICKLS